MESASIKVRTLCLFVLIAMAAFGQRSTGVIRGTVFDPSSAIVPGAQIIARDVATGLAYTTTSGSDGSFLIPNLLPGNYEVTVTGAGFQTSVSSNVIVETGRTTDLPVKVNVSTLVQNVQVTATEAALETTSNLVADTIRNDYIKDLPISGRDTLQFAALSAGYGGGTFNGLFQAALNVSLDGTNVNDSRFHSTNGFASQVPLRLDAVEEVTVSTSGMEADSAAGGAMTIRLTTRRGSSEYHGALFEQFRNDKLNANDFFNNMQGIRRPTLRLNDFGGSFSGPMKIPFAHFLKNKLFFFVNLEDEPVPGSANAHTAVLTPEAQDGIFPYVGTDGIKHTVNVLQLAGANGYQSTLDPTVRSTLGIINASTSKGALIPSASNLFTNTLNWQVRTGSNDIFPTARLDYQITSKVAWHVTWNLQHEHVDPGVASNTAAVSTATSLGFFAYAGNAAPAGAGYTYPGLPLFGASKFTHYSLSNGLDWTVTPHLFNSVQVGISSSVNAYNTGNSINQWQSRNNEAINFGLGISDTIPGAAPVIRSNPVTTFSDDLSWIKGKHTMKFGGRITRTDFYDENYFVNNITYSGIATYTLGVSGNDPINSVFTPANIPFINTLDVANAAQLYATLTGRVSGVVINDWVNSHTHQYQAFSPIQLHQNYASSGLYFQDSYRVTPRLTLNYGLRWEFTGVNKDLNHIYMNPTYADLFTPSYGNFQPGVLQPGNPVPQLLQRSTTYKPSRMNPGPNLGFAWNPNVDGGFLGKLLGNNKTVIRSNYGVNYFDEGLNTYYWVDTNPGDYQMLTAAPGYQYAPGSLTLASPTPPLFAYPKSFQKSISAVGFAFQGGGVSTTAGHFNGANQLPTMKNPYVESWNFGIQREVANNTVLEVRYAGNRTVHKWHLYPQEVNIFENGFLKEFVNAQHNLAIDQAHGVNSFQNLGFPGDVPLPIYEAAFGARGSQPALPTSQGFESNTFIRQLQLGNAGSAAYSLSGAVDPTYFCRIVGSNFGPCSGLGYNAPSTYPENMFWPNEYWPDALWTDDNSWSTYNGLQVSLRRRLGGGLTLNANYTFSKALSDFFGTLDPCQYSPYATIRNFALNKSPSSFDIRHVFTIYGTYDLPFGKNRHFAISNGLLNRIVGGWTISGIGKVTSGNVIPVTGNAETVNDRSPGDVILQGLSLSQLQGMLNTFSPGPTGSSIYGVARALVGGDFRANTQYLSLPNIPGQFGQFLYVYGPGWFSLDTAIKKEVPIREHLRFIVQAEFLNVLNHPVFSPPSLAIYSTSFGQISSAVVAPRNIQLRAYLRW